MKMHDTLEQCEFHSPRSSGRFANLHLHLLGYIDFLVLTRTNRVQDTMTCVSPTARIRYRTVISKPKAIYNQDGHIKNLGTKKNIRKDFFYDRLPSMNISYKKMITFTQWYFIIFLLDTHIQACTGPRRDVGNIPKDPPLIVCIGSIYISAAQKLREQVMCKNKNKNFKKVCFLYHFLVRN